MCEAGSLGAETMRLNISRKPHDASAAGAANFARSATVPLTLAASTFRR
jgi:hypothetical protein